MPPYGAARESSGSNRDITDRTCGQPSSSEIDGFPTEVCGSPSFDKDLDDKIAYLNVEGVGDESDLQSFAPGLKDFNTSHKDGPRWTRRSPLHRRALPKFVIRIGNVSTILVCLW